MRWLARGEIELPTDLEWLSALERDQLDRIRFTKRAQEYLTRRWTAKHAVVVQLGLGDDEAPERRALASIEVRNHPSGAPWVAVDGSAVDVAVSLTDRAGWAVCLVGGAGSTEAIGVDLELVEPRTEGFISDYLTAHEREVVRSEPAGAARDAMANLMWSAKEAALKVLQVGLRADTRTVEVTVGRERRDDGWSELVVTSRDGDRFPGWWRRDGEFVLTVAARTEIEPPARMPGAADLATATPLHSWLERPHRGP